MGQLCSRRRKKRDTSDENHSGNGTENRNENLELEDRPCTCPPAGTSTTSETPLDHSSTEVHLNSLKQLYCRTGFNLIITKQGKVRGTRKPYHKYAVMELSSVAIGELRIRSHVTGRYLAMNERGKLYTVTDVSEEGTVFVESYLSGWNTYLSRKYGHFGWYVSINKVGKAKAGHKTTYDQKAVMFLPRAPYPAH